MSSNINPFNIDGAYPVAGQDNSSQGFRDNFTNIRNNLASAKSEIEDLQNKALLKSALTGTTLNNNLAGSVLSAPALQGFSETIVDHSNISGTVSLDFSSANVHKMTSTGSITLSFASTWPASGSFGRMIVWLTLGSTSHTLILPSSVTLGYNNITGLATSGSNNVITFDNTGTYIFAFSTIDGGTNVHIEDMTRNYQYFQDPTFYFNDSVNLTFFVGYANNLNYALSTVDTVGNAVVSVYGAYSAVSVGNLQLANLTYKQLDTGKLSGYTVTSARGNLQTSTLTGVKSNDLLGYHNAVAYSGINNSGNTFQQTASINFYATGSNVTYGLGGNISFFTADDGANGGNGPNTVFQVVGMENDRSTRIFSNLTLAAIGGTSSSFVPASCNDTAGSVGQIAWSNNYLYIKVSSAGLNSWGRVQLPTTW
jgi:hypothetical protein